MSVNAIKTNNTTTPTYYHRDYKHDLGTSPTQENSGSWVSLSQRVATAALPFFSLYKPFGFTISLTMGSVRVVSSSYSLYKTIKTKEFANVPSQLFQTSVAIIAVTGTIFAHPLGMLVTTAQDLILDTIQIVSSLREGDYKQALESSISILNNLLYLTMLANGGLELAIASISVQILIGLYRSALEFKNGRYIEGSANLLMCGIRTNQLIDQVEALKFRNIFYRKLKEEVEKLKAKPQENPTSSSVLTQNDEGKVFEKRILAAATSVGVVDPELLDIIIKYGNNPMGLPVLHYAIIQRDHKAVDLLLKHGASPITKDHNGCGTLYHCIMADDLDLFKKFVKLGADQNEFFKDPNSDRSYSLLCFAIKEHKNAIAKFLIENGARQDQGLWYSESNNHNLPWKYPVTFACCIFGNHEMLKFQLDRGAGMDSNPTEAYGAPLVLRYILSGQVYDKDDLYRMTNEEQANKLKCLDLLINRNLIQMPSNPDAYAGFSEMYPKALTYLLDHSYISPNQIFGQSHKVHILHCMGLQHSFYPQYRQELIEILIAHGTNIHIKDAQGRTAFHLLCQSSLNSEFEWQQRKPILELFWLNNLDINARDFDGKTCLYWANHYNNLRLAEWLKIKGATL